MSAGVPPDGGFSFRSVLPMLVVDVACPYLTYRFLRQYVPGIPIVFALALSGVFPALGNVVSLIRNRTLDIIGIIVLVGIAVSIVAAFVGGDPKVVLIRESFVTGALGVVCLLSLLWPRPLLFYIGREFIAGHDPARIARFNAVWQQAGARRTFRIMTIVWGLGWVGEFLAKVGEVLVLSIPQVLIVGPIVSNGATIGLILWTIRYARRSRQQANLLRATDTAESQTR
jgi:hypothetical protein